MFLQWLLSIYFFFLLIFLNCNCFYRVSSYFPALCHIPSYCASILQEKFFKSITTLNGYRLMIYGHNRRHKWHRVYRSAEIKADLRHSFPSLLPTPKQNSSKTERFLLKVWHRQGMNLTYPASSDHS